jgi:hypothetical protein
VGLKQQLGQAVMKRIEAMPSVKALVERQERLAPPIRAATQLAYGAVEDDAAKAQLGSRLSAQPELLREAAIERSKHRENYVEDRAYRLLSAAAADAPVPPIPPERADLFSREAALGRAPMQEAFGRLASLEPALAKIESDVLSGERRFVLGDDSRPEGLQLLTKSMEARLRELVGGGAQREDELLRSNLAGSIVHQYLRILAGDAHLGKTTESFFETPRKSYVATLAIRRGPADARQ